MKPNILGLFFSLVFEQQNSVPLGTLGKAIRTGGEVNAWKRFMRGEIGAEEFVEAFGRQCSEIVSLCLLHHD